MYRLSLSLKTLIIGLVITLFSNSIGYAKEPSIPSASSNCGEWKIEIADSSNDNRIGVTLLQQATGNDCAGTFTLENQTGTSLGGGYSLELTTFSNNANAQFLPYGDPFLIPGLNIEIKTTPIDISQQASITLQGEVTLGSDLAVDFSLFLMKTALDLIPLPTGCLISYDQLFLISLRTAPILEKTATLASEGDLIGSKAELSRVITVFQEKAADTARDIGIGCFADFLKSILGKPIVIGKIVLSYITWVPVVIFDYFKYQGRPVSIRLSYILPSSPTVEVPVEPPPSSGITNNVNDLIGVWEGDLEYQTDSGDKGTAPVVLEFSYECNVQGSPCLINRDPNDTSNNWLLPFLSQNGPEFCFGTDVMVRYCFTQQADGTLWANGGNGFVINTGFLHRKTVAPLNLADPESIVYWLVHDLAYGSIDSFNKLLPESSLWYGPNVAGGREQIDTTQFLKMLSERIVNKPICVGYIVSYVDKSISNVGVSIMLWTKNWQPLWDWNGSPVSDEIVFGISGSPGEITSAWFVPSSAILEVVDHKVCPVVK